MNVLWTPRSGHENDSRAFENSGCREPGERGGREEIYSRLDRNWFPQLS